MFVQNKQYCLYGVSGYNGRVYLEVPLQGAQLNENHKSFNMAISKSRVTVEWMFKEIKMFWTTMDYKRKLRILQAPSAALYFSGMVLCNIRNCMYPNEISQYFQCPPPRLDEFLSWRG